MKKTTISKDVLYRKLNNPRCWHNVLIKPDLDRRQWRCANCKKMFRATLRKSA